MSANNYILINQDNFEVSINDAETGTSFGKLQKARSLEDAIEIAQKIEGENIIEYGIAFTKRKTTKKNAGEKTFLYIDGTNLLAGLVDMFGVDKVPSFSIILKRIKSVYKFNQIFFYASFTSSKGIKKLNPAKQDEIKKQIGLEIEFFKEVQGTKNLTFYQGYRSPASKKEKGVDVHLAVDFVKGAFLSEYNTAIILTGDADLIYPVQIAKTLGFEISSVFVASRFSRGIMFESRFSLILGNNSSFPTKKIGRTTNKFKVVEIKKSVAQKNPRSKRAR